MTTEIEIVPLEERICAAAMFAQVVGIDGNHPRCIPGCSEHEACELKILQSAKAISELSFKKPRGRDRINRRGLRRVSHFVEVEE